MSSSPNERSLPTAAAPVRPYVVLGVCCLSLLLIGMDVTIVNVALPAIQSDLHATLAGLQWVIDAYTIVLASLLIFSGSMSDRYGRRLVFQTGLTIFAVGSLLCSMAHSVAALSVYRALQGLGASMLNPVALSIIANVFPNPRERVRAIGVWGAVMGLALAAGPVLGGALTQTIGWRSIFWINLPICVLAIALAVRYIPESRGGRRREFDAMGQILSLVALFAITYAIIEGPQDGWGSARILGLFAAVVVSTALFFYIEPRRRDPLIDPRFFASAPFSCAMALALLTYACFSGFLFLNALYLQQVRGLSAFHTGLCTLPFAVAIMVMAPVSGWMVGRYGPRASLAAAGSGFLASSLILVQLTAAMPLSLLMLSYALFGVGLGMINPSITNNAVSGMPLAQAGVAGAVASTSRQVGTALGVAIAGTVVSVGGSRGGGFLRAAQPIWWAMTASAVVILVVGWAASAQWARRSAERVAARFEGMSADDQML